jgi:hypothetical protein
MKTLTSADRKLAWEMAEKSALYVGCVKCNRNAEYILQHIEAFDEGLARKCFYCGVRQLHEGYTECWDCGKKGALNGN